jgi:hypothetical protein
MAMNKKEQAAMKAAIDRAELLSALRWTMPVAHDVAPPANGYSQGWDFSAYNKTVWLGWSSCANHGTVLAPKKGEWDMSATQGCRSLYSTKALALAALRHEVERRAAADLMKIDWQIADAKDQS